MTPFQIEITDEEVQHLTGKSKQGNDYDMRLQTMYLHGENQYPDRFELPLPRGIETPYKKGFYPYKTTPRIFGGRIINDIQIEGEPSINKIEPVVKEVKPVAGKQS